MKGLSQSIKMKYKPEEHLMEKILNGDKSDNIPPCRFNTAWVQILVPPKLKVNPVKSPYIKCNKKILDYYRSNPKQLDLDISQVNQNGEEYVKDCKQNRTLIDFNSIPANISNEIWKLYKAIQ
jgi:hypothetical protein